MKMKTYYWGAEMIAETDKDKEALLHLISSLPAKNIEAYEGGYLEIVDEYKYEGEVKNPKLIIEICR